MDINVFKDKLDNFKEECNNNLECSQLGMLSCIIQFAKSNLDGQRISSLEIRSNPDDDKYILFVCYMSNKLDDTKELAFAVKFNIEDKKIEEFCLLQDKGE